MNKEQAIRYNGLLERCESHGLTMVEVDALLRCERALTRWAERECGDGSNWAIERDEVTDKPYNVYHGPGDSHRYPIADREAGAIRRAEAIAKAHGLIAYHQGDPRGCGLYLVKPSDIPDGQCITGHYHKGIAICY